VNFRAARSSGARADPRGERLYVGPAGRRTGHTLSISEIPTHTHAANAASGNGTGIIPSGNLLAATANQLYVAPDNNLAALNPGTLANVGGSQAHLNMQPFLT
jgi:microcystin-dependent protein